MPSRTTSSDLYSISKLRTDLVRGCSLFSGMPDEDRAKVVAIAHQRTYPRGKTIFFEGDQVRQVILLISGSVKLSQLGSQGQEVILRIAGPSESLSGECFTRFSHCSTALAMTPCTALVWEANQFEAVAEQVPMLGRNISCTLMR